MSQPLSKASSSFPSQGNDTTLSSSTQQNLGSIRTTVFGSFCISIKQAYHKIQGYALRCAPWFQNYERNLQITCFFQLALNIGLIVETFVHPPTYDALSLMSSSPKSNIPPSFSIECTWIWIVHGIFFFFVTSTYFNPKFHQSLIYPIVLMCVLITVLLSLASSIYYLIYFSIAINGSMVCTDPSLCVEVAKFQKFGRVWTTRTFFYLLFQWFLIQPPASYFMVLLKQRKLAVKDRT